MYIFLKGNLSEGFKAHGPYSDFEVTDSQHQDDEGWSMPLEPLKPLTDAEVADLSLQNCTIPSLMSWDNVAVHPMEIILDAEAAYRRGYQQGYSNACYDAGQPDDSPQRRYVMNALNEWRCELPCTVIRRPPPFIASGTQDPLLLAAKCALADLEGIMPEHEPSGDRTHPGWTTIKELKKAIKSRECQ